MFEKAKDFIRHVISKMFPKKDIEDALGIEIPINTEMMNAIDRWKQMYHDSPPWKTKKVQSQNIPAEVASEIARLVTLEFQSEVTGVKDEEKREVKESSKAEYLNEQYQNAIKDIRIQTEYACALGGLVFKPYLEGDNIAVDFVQADSFVPVKFDSSGNITAIIFLDRIRKGDKIYTRLEYHDLLREGYYIINMAFCNETGDDTLGYRIPLQSVEEWADLEDEAFLPEVDKQLFAYFKIPKANTIDTKSPLGISVYENATELIKEADKLYSLALWEYGASRKRIHVDREMIRNQEIELEDIYVAVDGEEGFIKEYSPEIRDTSIFNGLNKLLQKIEFNCGLAYGTISDVQLVEKTAEEIKTSKQRTFSTVQDIQDSLKDALIDLVRAMDIWATLDKKGLDGEYEISFDFDDSLAMDRETELDMMFRDVASQLIKPELYIMAAYGVEEEQAKKMMPNMADAMGEGEDDGFE